MKIFNNIRNNFTLFSNILSNKLESMCLKERDTLKIYNENNGYIIRETDGDGDGIKIIYDRQKHEFIVHILDDLNYTLICETIPFTSDKIKLIEKLDKSLNLKMVNWDWL